MQFARAKRENVEEFVKFISSPNPNSGIDALRLPSGRILIVYNDSSTLRTPLSMAASNDGGRTWKKLLDLETDAGEFSYPSVIQSSSGEVHIVYTWKRERIGHATIPHEWISEVLSR